MPDTDNKVSAGAPAPSASPTPNETPASGDKEMLVLKNPANGQLGNYDPKTAKILMDRKGYTKEGRVKQKDTSLAAVVTDKSKQK